MQRQVRLQAALVREVLGRLRRVRGGLARAGNRRRFIQGGAPPRWSCSSFEMGAIQARLLPQFREIFPTVREQTNSTRGNKRTLAELTPKDNDHLDLHTRQSNFIALTGLGGATASRAVRTAGHVAAVLRDEDSSRPAARALGAFSADAAAHPTGGSAQAARGPLGSAVAERGRAATVSAPLEEAFKIAPSTRRAPALAPCAATRRPG